MPQRRSACGAARARRTRSRRTSRPVRRWRRSRGNRPALDQDVEVLGLVALAKTAPRRPSCLLASCRAAARCPERSALSSRGADAPRQPGHLGQPDAVDRQQDAVHQRHHPVADGGRRRLRKPKLLRTREPAQRHHRLDERAADLNRRPTVAAKMARISDRRREFALAKYALTCAAICCVNDHGTPFDGDASGRHSRRRRRALAPPAHVPTTAGAPGRSRYGSVGNASGVDEAGAQRLGDGVRARLRLQLGDDLGDVELGGVRGDAERAADLAVAEAVAHRRQHLALARRQRLEAGRRALRRSPTRSKRSASAANAGVVATRPARAARAAPAIAAGAAPRGSTEQPSISHSPTRSSAAVGEEDRSAAGAATEVELGRRRRRRRRRRRSRRRPKPASASSASVAARADDRRNRPRRARPSARPARTSGDGAAIARRIVDHGRASSAAAPLARPLADLGAAGRAARRRAGRRA